MSRTRGSIRRRGRQSWELKFEVDTPAGNRKTRFVTVRGKRQDAQKELTRLLGQSDSGTLAEAAKTTIAEHLRAWLKAADIQPKTRDRYSQLAEHQIIPHLGNVELQKLRPKALKAWHATLLEKGGKDGRALAPRTVGHAHRCLHTALQAAVSDELLARNVASVVSPPRVDAAQVEILDAGQIKDVLAKMAEHELGPICATALATGARRGELLALVWDNVDLSAGTMRIERALEETQDGGMRFQGAQDQA